MIPIVPLFIEGPLDAGEFGIGLTVAVFAIAAIPARPWSVGSPTGSVAASDGRWRADRAAGGALSGHTSDSAAPRTAGVMGIGEAASSSAPPR